MHAAAAFVSDKVVAFGGKHTNGDAVNSKLYQLRLGTSHRCVASHVAARFRHPRAVCLPPPPPRTRGAPRALAHALPPSSSSPSSFSALPASIDVEHRYNVKFWVPFIPHRELEAGTRRPAQPFAAKGVVKVNHEGGVTTKLVDFRPPAVVDSIGRAGACELASFSVGEHHARVALPAPELGRWHDLGTYSFVVVHGRRDDDDANWRVKVEAEGSDGVVLASRVRFTDALGCMKQCRHGIVEMLSPTRADYGCSAAVPL
jgi:hypothetical protein